MSHDRAENDRLKRRIPEQQWRRAFALGHRYLQNLPGVYRDGRPFLTSMPRPSAIEYMANLQHAQKARMRIVGGAAAVLLLFLRCGGLGAFLVIAAAKRGAQAAQNEAPAPFVLPAPPSMPQGMPPRFPPGFPHKFPRAMPPGVAPSAASAGGVARQFIPSQRVARAAGGNFADGGADQAARRSFSVIGLAFFDEPMADMACSS